MRLRVMLADADPENIKNFRTYIKLSFPDIRIVASLNSPLDFRERVREFSPQLILADIRFFGALSYQIVREVSEFFPDVRFIVYGSYNDSEYIQRIMEFGVIDYIYRPVRPADLERSLKCANDIFTAIASNKAINDSLYAEYKKNINIFREKFLFNLISGNITSKFEINTSIEYFGLPLTHDYTVMILKIDHFKKIILTLDEKDKHMLVYRMILIINAKLKSIDNGAVFLNNLNELVIIVGSSMSLDKIIRLGDEIKDEIYKQTRQGVTIGVGRSYKNPTEIFVSYKEADAALRYRGYIGFNSVIPIHYVEPTNNITYRYPMIKEEVLVYSSVIGEYDYCEYLLKQIIEALRNSGPLPEYLLSKIVMNIVISINRYASEQNILNGIEFTSFFPTKDIFSIKNLDEAYLYLSTCLQNFCNHVIKIRDENKNKIVGLAEGYINQRYSGNITISEIALYSHTTPEFLSNAFHEVKGKTINEYISLLRINKAKEIIKETDETDEIIAIQVGYRDVKAFKIAFKKYEGINTQEYRNKERS